MTIQFQIRGMKDDGEMRRRVETDLAGLASDQGVISAHVAFHHQPAVAPPYQAVAMLSVPGPDLHAAARDHTWPAAWQKVMTRLREQLEERRNRATASSKRPSLLQSGGRRSK